jgi:site-specific recombinase XerD
LRLVNQIALLDDKGLAITVVTGFLGYLRARGCSPDTIVAYAHDLRHLFCFFRRANIHYQEFTPRRTLDFLKYLRAVPSRRKVRKPAPELSGNRPEEPTTHLAPTTVNRILAAVSTFYEYLIVTEAVAAGENPLRKIPDIAAERVVPRYTPFLSLTTNQRPVRRIVRVRRDALSFVLPV